MIGSREQDPPPVGRGAHLILYDGVCGLCNRVNQFVLPRDPDGIFDFASLQSDTGRAFVTRFGGNPDELNTMFVVADYRSTAPSLLPRSRAALFIMRRLGAPWRWLAVLDVLPRALLDAGYALVARNRYRFFGRHDRCILPSPRDRQRFIDV